MKLIQLGLLASTALTFGLGHSAVSAQSVDNDTADSVIGEEDIVVTGSRIQRSGFDAPTPTTVIGEAELALGNRPSIAQVLNDVPQFRATSTPTTMAGAISSGVSTADMRGLGAVRTLTLLNGHRFVGANDLNIVPQNLVKRVDVVTGGASAAWGSGAVAGVVNIILDDDFTGWRLGAQTGISSRGDGARYGADIAWGTDFADGRGHFMIASEYMDERGIRSRKDRPKLESGLFLRPDGQLELVHNPNFTQIYNGGSILNTLGTPYNLVFQPDGNIGPMPLGNVTQGQYTIGGGGQNLFDYVSISAPYERVNLFTRASYDLTDTLTVWANFGFHRMTADYGLFPETPTQLIMPDNAFLTQANRDQLAAAGVTGPFILGRLLDDVGPDGMLNLRYSRRNLEGAIGLDGSFGDGWTYKLYYNHGEVRFNQRLDNQQIKARFGNAVDAVLVGNTPTCRINADAITTNDDAACVPINLFGNGNISDSALGYAFGGSHFIYTVKLDAMGASLSGQPFSTWAGPVDIAIGSDVRWEKQVTNYVDPLSLTNALSTLNATPTNGSFNVKEVFAEVNVPLLDIADAVKLEVNGAARYSDYSTSGGIWSWKTGGTLRLASDLLLRAVYSRDIRSPSINEYFLGRSTNIGNVTDPFPDANGVRDRPQASVAVYSVGNANLTPEIAHTLTLGGSYSPHYVPGLRLSVDYYDIDIDNVITTITAQDLLQQCYAATPGDPSCNGIVTRKPNGDIQSMTNSFRNLANYNARGIDFEASYRLAVGNGNLTFRALANHILQLNINGAEIAGIVGGETAFSTPKWRGTATIAYDQDDFGINLRTRYVGGGDYSALPIVNGKVDSRTYVDLGLQFKAGPFTLFGNVNNLFDRAPPFTPFFSPTYDVIGRYISGGVKLSF
ncbi:TonB-dependent receptor plug domain-containing protein [Sphingopyxis sp. R3-92]|uniref:TonB-dependent receptor plug domain-containing protein n=1 Tax=Sphingopyxis sp. R3-92 TaxID=3158553 RepID=UPI003EE43243